MAITPFQSLDFQWTDERLDVVYGETTYEDIVKSLEKKRIIFCDNYPLVNLDDENSIATFSFVKNEIEYYYTCSLNEDGGTVWKKAQMGLARRGHIHTEYVSTTALNDYQKKLTAGSGIVISAENIISATGTIEGVVSSVNDIDPDEDGNVALDSDDIPYNATASVQDMIDEHGEAIDSLEEDALTADDVVPILEVGDQIATIAGKTIYAPSGGGGGGSVSSVNNKVGTVVLYGSDINVSSTDSTKINAKFETKQDTLTQEDKQTIADMHNDAVTSVNGQTGVVVLSYTDVEAASASHNHNTLYYKKSEVDTALSAKQDTLTQSQKQAIADLHSDAVTSVNGETGAVVLDYNDVGAAQSNHNHNTIYYTKSETETKLDAKQNTLTAGSNIIIQNNTISAADTTYEAGTGISIVGNTISVSFTQAEGGEF